MVDRVLSRPLFRGRSGMEMEARRVVPSPVLSGDRPFRDPLGYRAFDPFQPSVLQKLLRAREILRARESQEPSASGMEMEARDSRRISPSATGIESALMATDPYLLETFAPLPPSNRPRSARELAAEETGSAIRSGLGTFADRTAGALSAVGSGLYGVSADLLSPAFATLGATTLAGQMERASDIAYNVARSNLANGLSATEGMSAADFDMEPAQFDFVIARAEADARRAEEIRSELPTPAGPSGMEMEARGRVPPSSAMGRSGMEREARGSRPIAPLGVSGMEAEARGSRLAATAPESAVPGATDQGPSPMEADARARAPLIANPAEVAAGMNAPDPAVRERTVKDYMEEYMSIAPKAEGTDKYLMRAMIGFAIAAGESPNAMSNIANGLLAGSQAMMKDKAEKDAFDRQIQLTAFQYGLTEVAKDRDLSRSVTDYVAGQDLTYKGRKYPKGSNVPVLNSDVINGRVPEGVVDTALAASLIERGEATQAAMVKLYEDKLVDNSTVSADRKRYAELVDTAVRMQRSNDLFEKALFSLGDDGDLTGVPGALKNFVYKAANLAGVDPGSLDSMISKPAELERLLVAGATAALPAYTGNEAGNAISNQDVSRAIGTIVSGVTAAGSFEALFKNDTAVMRNIQMAMRENRGQISRLVGEMRSMENTYAGLYLRSGTISSPVTADTIFSPIRESAGLTPGGGLLTPDDIIVDENGVWNLYNPGE